MAGYRQWADGDILTPTDIDEYLIGQTMMRFANAAARTAALPSPVAGMQSYLVDTGLEYIYANSTWAPKAQFILKPGPETVTSNVTLQDDDNLRVNLLPGSYRVELFLHASGAAAGDIQMAWNFAGTATQSSRTCFGPSVNSTNVEGIGTASTTNGVVRASTHAITTAIEYGVDGSGSSAIHEDLFLVVTAAGLLKLQWAQKTSSATATSVSSASRMYVTRLA